MPQGKIFVGLRAADSAWEVRRGPPVVVLELHATEDSAVRAGLERAKREATELVVHRIDGSVAWRVWFDRPASPPPAPGRAVP